LNQRVAATGSDFAAALMSARAEAMSRSQGVIVRPQDGTSWNSGWIVFVDGNFDKLPGGASDVTLRTFDPPNTSVTWDTTKGNGFVTGDGTYVMYSSNGFARQSNGAFLAGCLTFKATNNRRTSIILDATGRPRTCDPDKSGDCGTGC
jgi:type IV fimbrial biogenesis protein FimT